MASSRNSLSTEAFCNRVADSLTRLVPRGARVALGFSGGLDSRFLLHCAARLATGGAYSLRVVHVHHGLNPAADDWVALAERVCAALTLPLEVVRLSVPNDAPAGLEGAARTMRYAAFDALAVDHVLLAQHADDQAETVLLNLLRGCGVRGAAAMQAVSGPGGRYLRPLLDLQRADIQHHAQILGLEWAEDPSNEDVRFTRNYLRQRIMPLLRERFPAAVDNLARAAGHFAEAQEMLDEIARSDLGAAAPTFPLSLDLLKGLPERRALNLLRYLLAEAGLQSPSQTRLREVLRQFVDAAPDRHPHLDLPAYRLFRRQGQIHLAPYSS